jgi:leucyl-tRNA synthetase
VWRLVAGSASRRDSDRAGHLSAALSPQARALRRKTHQTISKVTADIERMHFNTAVSGLMEQVNSMDDFAAGAGGEDAGGRAAWGEACHSLTLLLAPFAPHVAEELWHLAENQGSVCRQRWPAFDPEVAQEELITLVVQVNGKVRDRLTVARDLPEDELEALALASRGAQRHVAGKQVLRIVVVPNKLVSIVTG